MMLFFFLHLSFRSWLNGLFGCAAAGCHRKEGSTVKFRSVLCSGEKERKRNIDCNILCSRAYPHCKEKIYDILGSHAKLHRDFINPLLHETCDSYPRSIPLLSHCT